MRFQKSDSDVILIKKGTVFPEKKTASILPTRRERLKSAPYIKLKAQNMKFLNKKFFQKESHSSQKCKRGILLDLLTYIPLQNIKKTRRGDSEKNSEKNFEKKSHSAKKIERGTLWKQKKIRKKSHSAEKN